MFISSKSEDYPIAEKVYDFLVANGLTVFLASTELRRIGEATTYHFNGPLTWDQGLSLVKTKDEYSIFASTYCEFETIPTIEEIRGIITQTVDLMDNENFRSSIYTLLSI